MMRASRLTRLRRASHRGTVAMAASLLLAGCADAPTASEDGPIAPVSISAALAGTDVQALSVQVSGPSITVPIVVNASVPAGGTTASATVSVPVGGQRTFAAHGFDAEGIETYSGMATVTVKPAGNAPIVIRMYPKTADVPVTIGTGSYAITITPGTMTDASIGDTRQLSAAVRDADGVVLPNATVMWGSLNPIVASVSNTGLVTPLAAGTTTIVASWQGAASSVELGVSPSPLSFTQVSAGDSFSCALDTAGAAWCWGRNMFAELGNGTSGSATPVTHPTRVSGGLTFTSIAVSNLHGCGLTPSGDAWCWGNNSNGEASASPGLAVVPAPTPGGHHFSDIATGNRSSCGIEIGTRELLCWGNNTLGRLGVGSTTPSNVSAPLSVVGGLSWAAHVIGSDMQCGLTIVGAAYCWGDSDLPTRGLAAGATVPFSAPVLVSNAHTFVSIAVSRGAVTTSGISHFIATTQDLFACGLAADGQVRCWGNNGRGQLGSPGAGARVPVPTVVSAPGGFTSVAAGAQFACGLRGGTVLCWGRNDFGQLGDGTTTDRDVPTPVAGNWTFTTLSVGGTHACARRADGVLFCWGDNDTGQLGDGSVARRLVPTPVAPPLSQP
jgi:alpha-tubulin suppressor-like RCC1 family protein